MGLGEWLSLGAALAWAAAVILLRKSGEHLPPFTLNLAKNTIVLPVFALTLWLSGAATGDQAALSTQDYLAVAISGVLGIAVGDTFYFRALNMIGASRMAVAQALYSPSVILLSAVYLGERLGGGQWAGVALVLAGILLVTYVRDVPLDAHRQLCTGVIWAMSAVFMMALGVVIAKPVIERADFLYVVFLRILAGLAGLVLMAAARGQLMQIAGQLRSVRHWATITAAAWVGNYVAMMLWLGGYRYTQASIAAVFNELAAVFILPLAVVFLRERVHGRQIAGVLLALSGVALVVGFV